MQQTEYQSTLFIQTLFLTTNYFTGIYFNINLFGDRRQTLHMGVSRNFRQGGGGGPGPSDRKKLCCYLFF